MYIDKLTNEKVEELVTKYALMAPKSIVRLSDKGNVNYLASFEDNGSYLGSMLVSDFDVKIAHNEGRRSDFVRDDIVTMKHRKEMYRIFLSRGYLGKLEMYEKTPLVENFRETMTNIDSMLADVESAVEPYAIRSN